MGDESRANPEPMTQGEMMVWAATYAAELRRRLSGGPPANVTSDDELWEAWELDQSSAASEIACGAVFLMRNIERIEDGHAPYSTTAAMHRRMLWKVVI